MTTLDMQINEYETLLELSKKKTPIIVEGDIDKLTKITDEEQDVVDRIATLDAKRVEITKDIANVINTDVESLKLSVLIGILERRPAEQAKLSDIIDRLTSVVNDVKLINNNNRELINHSIEMVEFDLNLFKSMRQAPVTNNYGANGLGDGSILGGTIGGFDAKQ